jgi:hypothetical protein
MTDRCRCRPAHGRPPDPAAPLPERETVQPVAQRPRRALTTGAELAAVQAADAGALAGCLPADVLALVREHAARGGLAPAEWLGRAARAYAQEPASAAERQRASRERRAARAAAATNAVTSDGAE